MTRFGVQQAPARLGGGEPDHYQPPGRTKLHFLNPVPIAQIAHRWISKYAAPYAGALVDLDQHITSSNAKGNDAHHRARLSDLYRRHA